MRLALLLAAALLAQPLRAEEPGPEPASSGDREARLTRVEGAVYVRFSSHPEGEFLAAEQDMPLEAGDLVRTGTDGGAEVSFDGDSIIELGPDSDFIVASLDPQETEFHLAIGSLVAKIHALLEGRSLSIRTPSAVAAVRGTELAVSQLEDDQPTYVGVFDEGRVSVKTGGSGREVQVGPGQELEARRGAPAGKARAMKTLSRHREALARLRMRLAGLRGRWKARSAEHRAALRERLARLKTVRAEQLKNVRKDFARRRYEWLKRLRERRDERRLKRRESKKELRQERLEKARAEQGRRAERIKTLRREAQERRRKQARQGRPGTKEGGSGRQDAADKPRAKTDKNR
jgi:hypothetical protein